jgi:hypothetical protein
MIGAMRIVDPLRRERLLRRTRGTSPLRVVVLTLSPLRRVPI